MFGDIVDTLQLAYWLAVGALICLGKRLQLSQNEEFIMKALKKELSSKVLCAEYKISRGNGV